MALQKDWKNSNKGKVQTLTIVRRALPHQSTKKISMNRSNVLLGNCGEKRKVSYGRIFLLPLSERSPSTLGFSLRKAL